MGELGSTWVRFHWGRGSTATLPSAPAYGTTHSACEHPWDLPQFLSFSWSLSWFSGALISVSPLRLWPPWPWPSLALPWVPPHTSHFPSSSVDPGMLLSGALGHLLIHGADATSLYFLYSPLSASGRQPG